MRTKGLSGLSALLLLAAGTATAQVRSSCVECHQTIVTGEVLTHDFSDWKKSVHAGAGVDCESCHGGNAAAKDKASAHDGVLKSNNPKSRIYFTNIPETCGACHQPELKAFNKSAHSKELQSSGKGPNCVTCHGSMANVVLGAKEAETTCVLCHRQPTNAFTARLELDSAGAMARSLGASLRKARDAGAVDLATQEKAYREIIDLQRSASIQWHTFKMDHVVASAREVKRRVTELLGELKLKVPPARSKVK